MIDEELIQKAADLLLQAAPGAKVILFGSCARGLPGPDSDLDFLVVEPEVKSRFEEMIRLAAVLRPLKVPVDVVVVSAKTFEYWADTPSTLMYRAAREGRVYEQVA